MFRSLVPFLTRSCSIHPFRRHTSVSTTSIGKWGENRKSRTMTNEDKATAGDNVVTELSPLPEFIESRQKLWDKFKAEADAFVAEQSSIPVSVTLHLPSGEKTVTAESWKATPYALAREHATKPFADSAVISKVNGSLWDLNRPLEGSAEIHFLSFEDAEGQQVFWHSTAHMLGEACERVFGGLLCYGPPIENGFYYDMFVEKKNEESGAVTTSHFKTLESVMHKISKERQPFERLELTKAQLLEMFAYNQFKVRILNEKVKAERTTVYRCGTLIDLCLGPHVRNTGCVPAFKVTKASASHWEGKTDAETLQRVYGISFPEKKLLKDWEKFQEEAARRDHRRMGRAQGLFFFHELSPGACFFTPRGAHIYNTLMDLMRSEYRKRGFKEVITPNMYNSKLWKMSGHWDHYAENMFTFESEKETYALKPMNCPGHCLIFDSEVRSWRELPLRLADFGVLHRNEISGSLSGLTRVRRFQQDDAHIFCAAEQIESEVSQALDFMQFIYSIFGFTFDLVLSTRPDKFLGTIEEWDQAEAALAAAMDRQGVAWTRNEGDGAFYGPKIDITIKDAMRRPFQCATIQLDFQLPIRFDLKYSADDGTKKKPVIVHRAIFGSLERFIAILTENFGGKWPFWLSPMQAQVLAITSSVDEYAKKVHQQVHDAGFQVEINLDASQSVQKKIRNAQLEQFNFILVVGEQEEKNGTVNVRTRDNKVHGEVGVEELLQKLRRLSESRTLKAEEDL